MGSNWQIGPNCPHEVPNNQWMYLDGLMSNFEDWLFGGNDINVYHIGDNIVSSHNRRLTEGFLLDHQFKAQRTFALLLLGTLKVPLIVLPVLVLLLLLVATLLQCIRKKRLVD